MFLFSILQKDVTELVRRVYEAQKNDPSPGDFILLVKSDFARIGVNISDNEISKMKKQQFRKLVKTKTSDAAFKYLQRI